MTDTLIADALDSYLEAIEEPREPDGSWHPSSLFNCDRQAVYEVRGTEPSDKSKPAGRRPLEVGKLFHTLLQASVENLAVTNRIEQAFHEVKVHIPDLNVKGSSDSLIVLVTPDWDEDDPRWTEWSKYEVEEFKSTKSSGIRFAKGGFAAKPYHIAQALTYVYAMRYHPFVTEAVIDGETVRTTHLPLGNALRTARVTYIGKDGSEVLEFLVDITPEWEASFRRHIERLERYRIDGEALPPRLPREGGEKPWICRYCKWRTRCWSADGEGVSL